VAIDGIEERLNDHLALPAGAGARRVDDDPSWSDEAKAVHEEAELKAREARGGGGERGEEGGREGVSLRRGGIRGVRGDEILEDM
jgi:hypothetical protein